MIITPLCYIVGALSCDFFQDMSEYELVSSYVFPVSYFNKSWLWQMMLITFGKSKQFLVMSRTSSSSRLELRVQFFQSSENLSLTQRATLTNSIQIYDLMSMHRSNLISSFVFWKLTSNKKKQQMFLNLICGQHFLKNDK